MGLQPGPLKGAVMRERSYPIPNTPPRTPQYTNHAICILMNIEKYLSSAGYCI